MVRVFWQLLYITVIKPDRSEEEKLCVYSMQFAKKGCDHNNIECTMCAEQFKDGTNSVYIGAMCYSLDYGQQVHFLSNSLQPGPLFFKTTSKYQVLGIIML